MSALDGETLTLPPSLALAAGFNSRIAGAEYPETNSEDNWNNPVVTLQRLLNNKKVGNSQPISFDPAPVIPTSYNPVAPQVPSSSTPTWDDEQQIIDSTPAFDPAAGQISSKNLAMRNASLRSAGINPDSLPDPRISQWLSPKNLAMRNASLRSAGIDPDSLPDTPESINPVGYNNASTAHPLLEDSRFHDALRQDPKRAQAMYNQITGRNFESDYSSHVANIKTISDEDKKTIDRLKAEGLDFNVITGRPVVRKQATGYGAEEAMRKGQAPPTYERELTSDEMTSVLRSYKRITGNSIPTGISTPAFSTPQESQTFKETVNQYVKGDQSRTDLKTKVARASDTVQRKIWNDQQQAAALVSNPATTNANQPGTLAKILARSSNLQHSIQSLPLIGSKLGAGSVATSRDMQALISKLGGGIGRTVSALGKTSEEASQKTLDLIYQLTGGSDLNGGAPISRSQPAGVNDWY